MYKIPAEYNLSEWIDDKVNSISFGINYVIISFDRVMIQFSGEFAVKTENGIGEYPEVFPVKTDYGLLSLLGKEIVNVSTNENRDSLLFEFENSNWVHLKSSNMYESFEILIDGKRIII